MATATVDITGELKRLAKGKYTFAERVYLPMWPYRTDHPYQTIYDSQKEFLGSIVESLRSTGRDVFVSKTRREVFIPHIGHIMPIGVPAIRERQSGLAGKLRNFRFRWGENKLLEPAFEGNVYLAKLTRLEVRDLGKILYQIGDDLSDIQDPKVRRIVEEADKRYPVD